MHTYFVTFQHSLLQQKFTWSSVSPKLDYTDNVVDASNRLSQILASRHFIDMRIVPAIMNELRDMSLVNIICRTPDGHGARTLRFAPLVLVPDCSAQIMVTLYLASSFGAL